MRGGALILIPLLFSLALANPTAYLNEQLINTYAPNGTFTSTSGLGWVEVSIDDGMGVNAGSVVNITMTGGWLDLSGGIGLREPIEDTNAVDGELNIALDGDAWLVLPTVDTSSNTTSGKFI